MAFFENKSIDLLTKKGDQNILTSFNSTRKSKPSTQNQYINAIKFYYEKSFATAQNGL